MSPMEYERTEYPRPQFERSSWMNLNGEWDFTFDDHNEGEHDAWYEEPTFDQTINVPFSYETKASGIGIETFHPYVWYHRTFNIPIDEKGKRTILRFQASDYIPHFCDIIRRLKKVNERYYDFKRLIISQECGSMGCLLVDIKADR